MSTRRVQGLVICAIPLILASGHAFAGQPQPHATRGTSPARAGGTDAALASYIQRVQAASAAEERSPGAIWADNGRLTRLVSDVKALHPHDLLSIIVSENLSATTDGSVKNSRASNANSQVAALFGQISKANSLQNLVNQSSSSGLNAQGQSTTDSSLNTVVGGEIVDVLPNGILVVEADRQVSFNQQTQLIRMRGLVRPEDVSPINQVLSTSVTDLELEVVGKGIINDYTYRQNPLVRFLQRLVIF